MHSLILHIISKFHPLWQVHAQSHLTRNLKIPPLWQVHAQSHLTHHINIPPPLASTCTVSSYTSYQNPTPSGKYMHSLILHVNSKSHPLWQVHAQSHLTSLRQDVRTTSCSEGYVRKPFEHRTWKQMTWGRTEKKAAAPIHPSDGRRVLQDAWITLCKRVTSWTGVVSVLTSVTCWTGEVSVLISVHNNSTVFTDRLFMDQKSRCSA